MSGRKIWGFLALALAVIVTGCGGDGGGTHDPASGGSGDGGSDGEGIPDEVETPDIDPG